MKKFELTREFATDNFGKKLFRIRALIKFGNVKAGENGGYIESEKNLSQDGNAWVSGNAWVTGDARVSGNARVTGDACVSGDARVTGDAWVSGNAWVSGDACVSGGDACVSGNACVSGDADYAAVKGFGREYRNTTFFRCKDKKIRVVCGCFYGDLDEFREEVEETHGDGKMAREYLAIADLMEMHFSEDDGDAQEPEI